MPQRRQLFGPQYGTAPIVQGGPTGEPLPKPGGPPPRRLPIGAVSGQDPAQQTQTADDVDLSQDPYAQLIRMLQINGVL